MERKKKYVPLPHVQHFIDAQSVAMREEYATIVDELETTGTLRMPLGEKIAGENLFAIRVIQAANIRVFYVYGLGDKVFGIHGYVKKTRTIPQKHLSQAKRVAKVLQQKGLI